MEVEKLLKEVTHMRAEELKMGVKDTRFTLALPYKKKGMRIVSKLRKTGLPVKYSTILSIAIMRGLKSIENDIEKMNYEDKE